MCRKDNSSKKYGARQFLLIADNRMPPKRSSLLQSPNPIKAQMVDSDEDIASAAATPDPVQYQATGVPSSENHLPDFSALNGVQVEFTAGNTALISAPLSTPPMTPPRSVAGSAVVAPLSSPTPRDRFLDGRTPVRICCNLDLMRAPAGASPDPHCVMGAADALSHLSCMNS
jgi:hypothetical protein